MKTLADRVKAAREAKGWSQSDLAREAGVKQQSIQQLEAGLVNQPRYLVKLADVLDVDFRWLNFGSYSEEDKIKPRSETTRADYEYRNKYVEKTIFLPKEFEEDPPTLEVDGVTYTKVPVYNFLKSRHYGTSHFEDPPEYYFLFPMKWIDNVSFYPISRLVIFKMNGPFMKGFEGKHVMVNCYYRDIRDPGYWFIRQGEFYEIIVKYAHQGYQWVESHEEQIYLFSDSPGTPPTPMPTQGITVVGRAVWSDGLL